MAWNDRGILAAMSGRTGRAWTDTSSDPGSASPECRRRTAHLGPHLGPELSFELGFEHPGEGPPSAAR